MWSIRKITGGVILLKRENKNINKITWWHWGMRGGRVGGNHACAELKCYKLCRLGFPKHKLSDANVWKIHEASYSWTLVNTVLNVSLHAYQLIFHILIRLILTSAYITKLLHKLKPAWNQIKILKFKNGNCPGSKSMFPNNWLKVYKTKCSSDIRSYFFLYIVSCFNEDVSFGKMYYNFSSF